MMTGRAVFVTAIALLIAACAGESAQILPSDLSPQARASVLQKLHTQPLHDGFWGSAMRPWPSNVEWCQLNYITPMRTVGAIYPHEEKLKTYCPCAAQNLVNNLLAAEVSQFNIVMFNDPRSPEPGEIRKLSRLFGAHRATMKSNCPV